MAEFPFGYVKNKQGQDSHAIADWKHIDGKPDDLAHKPDISNAIAAIPKPDLSGPFLYQQIKPLLDWNDIQNKPRLYTQAEVDAKINAEIKKVNIDDSYSKGESDVRYPVLDENGDLHVHNIKLGVNGRWDGDSFNEADVQALIDKSLDGYLKPDGNDDIHVHNVELSANNHWATDALLKLPGNVVTTDPNNDITIHDAYILKVQKWIASAMAMPTNRDWQPLVLDNRATAKSDVSARVVNGIVELRGTVTITGLSSVHLPTGCYIDHSRSFVVSNLNGGFNSIFTNSDMSSVMDILIFTETGDYDLSSIMYPAIN